MRSAGVQPNLITWSAALDACAKAEPAQWQTAVGLLREMQEAGIPPTVVSYNAAITTCGRAGELKQALQLTVEMRNAGIQRDLITWSALIDACAKAEPAQWETALALLREMQEAGIFPTVVSYNAAITACGRAGELKQALQLTVEMRNAGIQRDLITWSALSALEMPVPRQSQRSGRPLSVCCERCRKQASLLMRRATVLPLQLVVVRELKQALQLTVEMISAGIQRDLITWNALLDACAKAEPAQMGTALALLQQMQEAGISPVVKGYNAAIAACCNGGQPKQGLQLLGVMRAASVAPDKVTYSALLDGLQAAGLEAEADSVYAAARSEGVMQHWITTGRDAGLLDFHDFTTGMVMAAMRLVLHQMSQPAAQSSSSHVHDPSSDLHIITGHAGSRAGQDGSVLQPVITTMLKALSIECSISSTNRGLLIVKSEQLQAHIARSRLADKK